jgi:hypothetical protein
MGQGLYNLLGWGVLDLQWPDNENDIDAFELALPPAVRTSYETQPSYLVLALAVDNPWLQEYWHLPALPPEILRGAPRTARYAPEVLVPITPAMQQTWRLVETLAQGYGMWLPGPAVVVVNDWH